MVIPSGGLGGNAIGMGKCLGEKAGSSHEAAHRKRLEEIAWGNRIEGILQTGYQEVDLKKLMNQTGRTIGYLRADPRRHLVTWWGIGTFILSFPIMLWIVTPTVARASLSGASFWASMFVSALPLVLIFTIAAVILRHDHEKSLLRGAGLTAADHFFTGKIPDSFELEVEQVEMNGLFDEVVVLGSERMFQKQVWGYGYTHAYVVGIARRKSHYVYSETRYFVSKDQIGN